MRKIERWALNEWRKLLVSQLPKQVSAKTVKILSKLTYEELRASSKNKYITLTLKIPLKIK